MLPAFMNNIIFWILLSFTLIILMIVFIILFILLKLFTHAFDELKAKFSGTPICIFAEDTRYAEWKPIKPEAGMIEDKDYGTFIVNEQGSYIDRRTKNVYMFFDAGFGSGASVKAFKMSNDLYKVFQDESKMNEIRKMLINGTLDNTEIEGLRESINFSCLRSLNNTILPHNITAKIEKMLQQRLQGLNQVNIMNVVFLFVAVLGAIIIGAILLKMYG
jgi:hypothetical protein